MIGRNVPPFQRPFPMDEPKSNPKKTEKKNQTEHHQSAEHLKEMGEKAISSVAEKAVKLEKSFLELPIDRRMIVVVGVVILLSALMDDFGKVILVIVAVGMIYLGVSGKNVLRRWFGEKKKDER